MKRLACAVILLTGCDVAPAPIEPLPLPEVPEVSVPAVPPATDQACSRPHIDGARPLPGAPRVGSTVALMRHDARTLAYVADADAEAVRVVDVDAGRELSSTDVGGKPSALMALGDGRVMVTLSDRHRLAVLAPKGAPSRGLELLCTRPLPTEPVGLAASADEETLAVTSRWGKRLTVLDQDMKVRREVPLARDPHGVVLTSNGRATVAHAFGAHVSVVDLETGEVSGRALIHEERPKLLLAPGDDEPPFIRRRGTQAYTLVPLPDDEMALPLVLADPGDVRVMVSTAYYGGTAEVPVMASAIARVGAGFTPARPPSITRGGPECLLPRAGAYDPVHKLVWVTCLGVDRVIGYNEEGQVQRSVEVAAGPLGVAVDAAKGKLVTWSQFAGALTVAALDTETAAESPRRIALAPQSKLDPQVARGRSLFHEAGGKRIAFDGRACASCHPEGRDDSITWLTPEGPRQTPMLVGRLDGTAPYGWDGHRGDLHTYLKQTLRRLGGKGLTADERDALIAYLQSLEPPTIAPTPSELARRGAEIFAAAKTGCAGCHAGGTTTDKRLHDVGSATRLDRIAEIDTPSLRFLSQSAPYFHDGRYASLDAMLDDPHLKMGWTHELPPADRQALAAYLETL